MLKKAGTLLLICASLATWISCGKNTAHYLYAAIPGSSQIYVYREDPNSGILTELSLSPVAAGLSVQSLALHPSNKYLYAANAGEADVSLFTISSDGALTESFPRATTGVAPNILAIDPAGAYLYVANSGSNDISVFSIGTLGALTPIAGSPFQIGISPLNMALAPSGNLLFVLGGGAPGYVEAFSVSSGVLSTVAGSPFQTGNDPNGIAITSGSSFLYTSNADNSISEFSITNGVLAQLPSSPLGQEAGQTDPLSLLIDNSGNYLCVANENSANIGVYSIGSNGSLTALQISPFASDTGPSFIASDPSAEYLFVGTQISSKIQSFALSSSTGALTSVASYTVPGTPTSIVIVP